MLGREIKTKDVKPLQSAIYQVLLSSYTVLLRVTVTLLLSGSTQR